MRKLLNSTRARVAGAMAAAAVLAAFVLVVNPTTKDVLGQTVPVIVVLPPAAPTASPTATPAPGPDLLAGRHVITAPADESIEDFLSRFDPTTSVDFISREGSDGEDQTAIVIDGVFRPEASDLTSVNAGDTLIVFLNAPANFRTG